jgi:hypothetical protein
VPIIGSRGTPRMRSPCAVWRRWRPRQGEKAGPWVRTKRLQCRCFCASRGRPLRISWASRGGAPSASPSSGRSSRRRTPLRKSRARSPRWCVGTGSTPRTSPRGVGLRGMPSSWGWSRAAPAPQTNARRRLLRRLSDGRNRAETRAGGTRDVARPVRPCFRREKAITAFDSLRSRRRRTFAWGAGAARDQPQNVGIPRTPTPLWARHGIATAQGISHDEGNG